MYYTRELTYHSGSIILSFEAGLLTEPELSNLARAIGQQTGGMASPVLLSPVLESQV